MQDGPAVAAVLATLLPAAWDWFEVVRALLLPAPPLLRRFLSGGTVIG